MNRPPSSFLQWFTVSLLSISLLGACSLPGQKDEAAPVTGGAAPDSGVVAELKQSATVSGKTVPYSITFDDAVWKVHGSQYSPDSEFEFEHNDGNVYAMIIPEELAVPLETLKQIALDNAKGVAENGVVELLSEKTESINGIDVVSLKFNLSINGVPLTYYGHYYSGDAGSLQFIAYTGRDLMKTYEAQIRTLLSGLKM